MAPPGQRRKQPRSLQQKVNVPNGTFSGSRLTPSLSNIDRPTGMSRSIVSSTGGSGQPPVGTRVLATSIPATPDEKTVSDLTVGPTDQFNAFRVNEKSSLESYKQTMGFKLKADIFRKLKFVTNDSQMEFSMDPNSLCQYVCSEMHITGAQQGSFWTAVKDTVKRMIEKQRTNATSGCKRAFQGKLTSRKHCVTILYPPNTSCCKEIIGQEDSFDDICIRPDTLPLRNDQFLMYVDFVTYYVGAVVGLRHFEKHKCVKPYREYVTISDEAFAVLTLENNWGRWMAMAQNDKWTTAPVPTKWTVTRDRTAVAAKKARTAESNTGLPQARRYRGWSAEGINRYNQLYDQIKIERNTERGKLFEGNLLRHFRREADENDTRQRKGVTTEAPPMPLPRHELWACDTIVSPSYAKTLSGRNLDDEEDNDSDDDQDDHDKLPDYSRKAGV